MFKLKIDNLLLYGSSFLIISGTALCLSGIVDWHTFNNICGLFTTMFLVGAIMLSKSGSKLGKMLINLNISGTAALFTFFSSQIHPHLSTTGLLLLFIEVLLLYKIVLTLIQNLILYRTGKDIFNFR